MRYKWYLYFLLLTVFISEGKFLVKSDLLVCSFMAFFLVFLVLGIRPRPLTVLTMHLTTRQHQ